MERLHILDVCLVGIFALDTAFQNWDCKMKINIIGNRKGKNHRIKSKILLLKNTDWACKNHA